MKKKPWLNDKDVEETIVKEVKQLSDGSWDLTREDGWCFCVPATSPIVPKKGMACRFYGKIGHPVRGLFLDGTKVFYRTVEEQEEKNKVDNFGKDADEWLRRWDEGRTVWSIEMGGLGPGYEQAIQIATVEVLRILLKGNYRKDKLSQAEWDTLDDKMFLVKAVKGLGLSGAQMGGAKNLAYHIFSKGPIVVLSDTAVKDRHIQVSKSFPVVDSSVSSKEYCVKEWVE